MNKRISVVALLLVALLLAACGTPAAPTQTTGPGAAATQAARPVKPAWEAEWQTTVEAAKQEGRVVVYTGIIPTARDAIGGALKERFGLGVEWVVGRGGEIAAKVSAERAAGLKVMDVMTHGPITFANQIKPMGILAPLDPLLVLPEVTDPSKWIAGKLLFADKGHTAIQWVEYRTVLYCMNTDQVKPDEFSTTMDLLNPKWKGKMVLSDPSVAGNSNEWFTWVWYKIVGEDKAGKFMTDLAKQEPAVSRDERLMTEWVARGKYAIGIGIGPDVIVEFIRTGAPIAFVDVKEQRSAAWGGTLLMLSKDAPHPNAAKVFTNWLLSKDGGIVGAPAIGYPSGRTDVPNDQFMPVMIPRSGDIRTEMEIEDWSLIKGKMQKTAADIFAPLLK